ncbi:hypothetical protein [Humidesulfovibrio sp.]
MTTIQSLFAYVLAEALRPGPMAGPEALLAALEAKEKPLEALMRTEGADAIGMAIEQDFDFLRHLRMEPEAADSEAKGRWAALIRWVLATTKDWKQSEDARMKELVAVLMTCSRCSNHAQLWHLLPEKNAPSVEFLETVGKFAAKRQIVYGAQGSGRLPIWESEFIDAFQKADVAGDWAEIADMWPRLEYVARPDLLSTEMVCCLARFDFSELVRAADALPQCPLVMALVHALSVGQQLRLAIASSSERVRFCCAFTITRREDPAELSADDEAALSELLIKVAASPEEWRKWLAAFNTYPLRYPLLHRPLGIALAHANHEAALAYIDSIKLRPTPLTPPDACRAFISDCLQAFSEQASLEQRQAVWTHAHRRWLDWRFDTRKTDANLFEVHRLPLDFAVFSFVCECMSSEEREGALAKLQKQFQEVELAWYPSETDYTTEWNRLLSIFQPYAHACYRAEGTLLDSRLYFPVDLQKSLYHRIIYRVRESSTHPVSG